MQTRPTDSAAGQSQFFTKSPISTGVFFVVLLLFGIGQSEIVSSGACFQFQQSEPSLTQTHLQDQMGQSTDVIQQDVVLFVTEPWNLTSVVHTGSWTLLEIPWNHVPQSVSEDW